MRRKQEIETEPEVLYGTARLVVKWGDELSRSEVYALNPAKSMVCADGKEHHVAHVIVRTDQPGGALSPMRTVVLPAHRRAASVRDPVHTLFVPALPVEHAKYALPADDVKNVLSMMGYDIDDSALSGGPPSPALAVLSKVRRACDALISEASLFPDAVRREVVRAALAIEQAAITEYRVIEDQND